MVIKNKSVKRDKSLVNKAEIARRLGVSRTYISLILNNKRKAPKMREKITQLLQREISIK